MLFPLESWLPVGVCSQTNDSRHFFCLIQPYSFGSLHADPRKERHTCIALYGVHCFIWCTATLLATFKQSAWLKPATSLNICPRIDLPQHTYTLGQARCTVQTTCAQNHTVPHDSKQGALLVVGADAASSSAHEAQVCSSSQVGCSHSHANQASHLGRAAEPDHRRHWPGPRHPASV